MQMRPLKNPRDENGPDGYPIDNPAFTRLAKKVLAVRADDLKKAEAFMKRLAESTR